MLPSLLSYHWSPLAHDTLEVAIVWKVAHGESKLCASYFGQEGHKGVPFLNDFS